MEHNKAKLRILAIDYGKAKRSQVKEQIVVKTDIMFIFSYNINDIVQ